MGDPISPYLTKKLNLNYESSTIAIQEAIKSGDKKKGVTPFRAKDNSSSRNAALRSLLFYSPAQAITENMKSCMYTIQLHHGPTLTPSRSSSDYTQRQSHPASGVLSPQHTKSALAGNLELSLFFTFSSSQIHLRSAWQDREAALKSFQTEMGEKSVARRLHCLRTFSHLVAPDSPTAREMVKFSQEIIEPPQAASKVHFPSLFVPFSLSHSHAPVERCKESSR